MHKAIFKKCYILWLINIPSWIDFSTCDGEVKETCMLKHFNYFGYLWSNEYVISVNIYPKLCSCLVFIRGYLSLIWLEGQSSPVTTPQNQGLSALLSDCSLLTSGSKDQIPVILYCMKFIYIQRCFILTFHDKSLACIYPLVRNLKEMCMRTFVQNLRQSGSRNFIILWWFYLYQFKMWGRRLKSLIVWMEDGWRSNERGVLSMWFWGDLY